MEAAPNGFQRQRSGLEAKPVQPKIRTLPSDCRKNGGHFGRSAIATAYRPYAHPHARRKQIAVHVYVPTVVVNGQTLQDGHDIDATGILLQQIEIGVQAPALMFGYRQAGALEHFRRAEPVLRDSGYQTTAPTPPFNNSRILASRKRMSSQSHQHRKGTAIKNPIAYFKVSTSLQQTCYRDHAAGKITGMIGHVQAGEKQHDPEALSTCVFLPGNNNLNILFQLLVNSRPIKPYKAMYLQSELLSSKDRELLARYGSLQEDEAGRLRFDPDADTVVEPLAREISLPFDRPAWRLRFKALVTRITDETDLIVAELCEEQHDGFRPVAYRLWLL